MRGADKNTKIAKDADSRSEIQQLCANSCACMRAYVCMYMCALLLVCVCVCVCVSVFV